MTETKLMINWQDLELAFEVFSSEFGEIMANAQFDLQSGEVVFVDEQVRDSVECICEELDEILEEGDDWTDDAVRGTDTFQQLSEAEKPRVLAAMRIEYGDFGRYESIPHFDSNESYQYMQDFIDTVRDDARRGQLSDAISQRKPFRRFRDVLANDRRLERQWRQFEIARRRETMVAWLHSIGVEPANPELQMSDLPPLPDLRKIMFAEVRRFVRFARDIQGVLRIALIGSLTTDKEFPQDIDMLVTIRNDCDLAPLAKLGRQLSGHMMSHQAGADVFLASEEGDYLGRTCPWKDCGPGYRVGCYALHCGVRHCLHDDFNTIRLNKKVIAQPPVLLWPELAASPNVPPDVREQLIEPLSTDG